MGAAWLPGRQRPFGPIRQKYFDFDIYGKQSTGVVTARIFVHAPLF
jgi:hypothetical protein